MKYLINPAKIAIQIAGPNINEANDICFDTCSAFGNGRIEENCAENCRQLMDNMKSECGRSPCSYQLPRRPPIFNNVNHYLPALLNKSDTLCSAVAECHRLCGEDQTCNMACNTDAGAVVTDNASNLRDNVKTLSIKVDRTKRKDELLIGILVLIILSLILYLVKRE
jgi:hypothetical protein